MSTPRVLMYRLAALLCVMALCTSPVFAQAPAGQDQPAKAQATMQTPAKDLPNTPSSADYTKGASMLSIVGPYKGRTVAPPNLRNAPRLDTLMRDGKLYLSLSDAIALALENNLDIAIARYNLNIADTDILRTKAGSAVQGVNTGLLTGTPGGNGSSTAGASGSGSGGTTAGAGGAATGTAGIVTSTSGAGPGVDNFDPILTGTLSVDHNSAAQSNIVTTGTANFAYQQGFQWGELLTVSFNNSRSTTNSLYSTLNPALNSQMRVNLRQHLLSGLSFNDNPNTRFIRIAKNNRLISDISFKNQVLNTVSQIQNIYWDLVNAYEDLKVKEHSLELSNRTLSDNKKQVEIGTLAPIEVVRAQSAVASSNQDLIVSQTNLQYQQLLMINAISRNMTTGTVAAAPVIPTDTMTFAEEPVRPVEDLIGDALTNRPEMQSSRINLKNDEINKKGARNALRPTLDLVGWYQGSGLAGVTPPSACTVPPCPPTGYGDALSDTFSSVNPDKGLGIQLTIPIRNRAAQATQIRSELEYRQAEMLMQQQANQIAIQVRNAAFAVQQNRARVDASRAARELAAQSLDAEQKKFALGASTSFNVLQAQRDLIQAETNVVSAVTAYQKSRVQLDLVTANTLERNGIVLSEANSGVVNHTPKVPGVVSATPQQ